MHNSIKPLILELSEAENALLLRAPLEYGEEYVIAEEIISYFNRAIQVTNQQNAWVFFVFLSQARSNLMLMLLSAVRKHDIQTLMMARQMLEASVLACYALGQQQFSKDCYLQGPKGVKKFIETTASWSAKRKDLLPLHYEWLDNGFHLHSENIKKLKLKINDYYAHAGAYTAQNTISVNNGIVTQEFFDVRDKKFVSGRVLICADMAITVMGMFSAVVAKNPGAVVLDAAFSSQWHVFSKKIDQLYAKP